MVMRFFLIIFILFSLLFKANCQQYNFTNYSVSEGLSQSVVNCIYEDHRGFLWFGTNTGGLDRFDGIKFTNYNTNFRN